ncbi:MAG TPA: STAS domain-containing protein [Planctomycetaceae bacterium]|nr:STAS domain-containing protein [Planctomycetaceae bacterium]
MISTPARRNVQPFFEVSQTGPLTRVAFANGELPHFVDDPACRDELLRIIRQSGCRRIVIDAAALRGVNSSLVALLLLPVRQGVKATVAHPSRHLRDVLRVTQLDRIVEVDDGPAGDDAPTGRGR